jgi:thioredoxin-like negative regulator of GroEL
MNRRDFGCAVAASLWGTLLGTARANASLPTKSKIKWQKDLRTAHDAAVEQDKPLLIVFGASWCTFCHKMQRETFTDRNVISLIDREFIAVTLDFDKETKVVEILEVEQLPCTVILSPEADLLLKHVGFAKADVYQKKLESALAKRAEIQLMKGTSRRSSR